MANTLKVTVKNPYAQHYLFTANLLRDTTILGLKEAISRDFLSCPEVQEQKIIHFGKILKDSQTLGDVVTGGTTSSPELTFHISLGKVAREQFQIASKDEEKKNELKRATSSSTNKNVPNIATFPQIPNQRPPPPPNVGIPPAGFSPMMGSYHTPPVSMGYMSPVYHPVQHGAPHQPLVNHHAGMYSHSPHFYRGPYPQPTFAAPGVPFVIPQHHGAFGSTPVNTPHTPVTPHHGLVNNFAAAGGVLPAPGAPGGGIANNVNPQQQQQPIVPPQQQPQLDVPRQVDPLIRYLNLTLAFKLFVMVCLFSQGEAWWSFKTFFLTMVAIFIYVQQVGILKAIFDRCKVNRQQPPAQQRNEDDRQADDGDGDGDQNDVNAEDEEPPQPPRTGILVNLEKFILGLFASLFPEWQHRHVHVD